MKETIIPSRHLIPYPDVEDSRTGEPITLEALAGLHYNLSTALIDAADSFLERHTEGSIPYSDGEVSEAIKDAAEKFAGECLALAMCRAQARSEEVRQELAFLDLQEATRKAPDALAEVA